MSTTPTFIIQPGWNNSLPDHWQSHWQERLGARRVENTDWHTPQLDDWLEGLDRAIADAGPNAVVIAHSLGAITVAHYAERFPDRIRAALLVAPADVERADAPRQIIGFAPLPQRRLPFPALVVASTNDPYCQATRAATFAEQWGAGIQWLEGAGHINAASGHRQWDNGLPMLDTLLSRAGLNSVTALCPAA